MLFMRSFILQQENNFLSLRDDVEATLPDKVKALLGSRKTGLWGVLKWKLGREYLLKNWSIPLEC